MTPEEQIPAAGQYQIGKLIEHLNKTLIEPLDKKSKEKTNLRFTMKGTLSKGLSLTISFEKP